MSKSSPRRGAIGVLACALLLAATAAPAQAPSRGQLLYDTHCLDCHNTQMHWRARRVARDWPTLVASVRHWQSEARLQWNEQDVEAVARHLNDTIYRFAQPQAQR